MTDAEKVWQILHDEDCPGHSQDELELIADGIRSSKLVCKTCHTKSLRQRDRKTEARVWVEAAKEAEEHAKTCKGYPKPIASPKLPKCAEWLANLFRGKAQEVKEG